MSKGILNQELTLKKKKRFIKKLGLKESLINSELCFLRFVLVASQSESCVASFRVARYIIEHAGLILI